MKYGVLTFFKLVFFVLYSKVLFGFKVRVFKGFPLLLNKKLISFGDGFTAGKDFRCEVVSKTGTIRFGKNVKVNDYVHIGASKSIDIGENVLIGSRVTIVDHDHGKYLGAAQSSPLEEPDKRELISQSIKICDNCWLGEGAVILKGVTLPAGTIVGANSVVTKSPSRACILGGIPARILKVYDDESGSWIKK
ncbi:DapH/DapD/GlmU-related protein [Pseudoalteromonas sp. T1lg21]|uniref:DapH/DapD/GlmU-related protein n=1 Tax=Pseudoalteromonas sp. T1lg21 TaxID=2077095 RepID=UPI000CF6C7DE|nr:DapH/DapD/GlmU-related protein [Pseudoalteromonas sp. T1lg21]